MFAQLKEEFIDVTMFMSISPSEFEKIQTMVFNKALESKLKNMFKHRADGSRLYAVSYTHLDVYKRQGCRSDGYVYSDV